MEVCFLVNSLDRTSVPADIAVGLARYTDVDVEVLAWFSAGPFEGRDLVGVRCLEAPRSKLGVDRQTYRDARSLIAEYDLLQVHHNHSGSFGKLLARSADVPVISREGNTRDGFTMKGRVANGMTNALADRVVCNARAVYDSFTWWERLLVADRDIEIIPNGFDFNELGRARELSWSIEDVVGDASGVTIGTASVLSDQKGLDVLIRAVGRARNQFDGDVQLVIAGEGPARSTLEVLAKRVGIADSVHFLGLLDRPRVYRMMFDVDIYAMPSRWEGFSAAALEAMGSGTACVFSDIPSFTEPYEGYARFHPVDDVDELARHIIELAIDEDERLRLGTEAQALVRSEYTIEEIAEQYSDLYAKVLAQR